MKGNIILIGFMGVGKGTVARALVKNSDYFAVDTDDLIESLENKKIKKIFEENGEPYFRELERKCALWCENNIKGSIISTGGGFYKQPNIKKIGKIIYLQSTFDNIIQGLKDAPNSAKKFKKRPLLNNLTEARKIYNQRVKEYENIADIVINVEDWDEKKAVKNILEKIN
ncbi:MAG: shikimate kinase [Campylobacterota bacterium]|nr:shikimate kinase [Campylobacterota bacterium]